MKGVFIKDLTYPQCCELINENSVIVLPIGGGSKEHGSHLPMGTDWYVTEYFAQELTKECEVITLPTLPYAYFPAFVEWKGSVSIEANHFEDNVQDILMSFVRFGVRKFLIIDGGISTHIPLSILAQTMHNHHHVTVAVTDLNGLASDIESKVCQQKKGGHADESETSTMLYLHKDLVKMEHTTEEYRKPPFKNIFQDGKAVAYVSGGMNSPQGSNGNSTLATEEKGKMILEDMKRKMVLFTEEFVRWNPDEQKDKE